MCFCLVWRKEQYCIFNLLIKCICYPTSLSSVTKMLLYTHSRMLCSLKQSLYAVINATLWQRASRSASQMRSTRRATINQHPLPGKDHHHQNSAETQTGEGCIPPSWQTRPGGFGTTAFRPQQAQRIHAQESKIRSLPNVSLCWGGQLFFFFLFFSFAYTTSPAAVMKLVVYFRSSKPTYNFWWSGVADDHCAIRSGWCLLHLWRTCSVVNRWGRRNNMDMTERLAKQPSFAKCFVKTSLHKIMSVQLLHNKMK